MIELYTYFQKLFAYVNFKRKAVILNLWIMIELDPLYKNVSDTSPPSLSKNMKNERPTIYHLKEENPEIPYI